MGNCNFCANKNLWIPSVTITSRTYLVKKSIEHISKIEKFVIVIYPKMVKIQLTRRDKFQLILLLL